MRARCRLMCSLELLKPVACFRPAGLLPTADAVMANVCNEDRWRVAPCTAFVGCWYVWRWRSGEPDRSADNCPRSWQSSDHRRSCQGSLGKIPVKSHRFVDLRGDRVWSLTMEPRCHQRQTHKPSLVRFVREMGVLHDHLHVFLEDRWWHGANPPTSSRTSTQGSTQFSIPELILREP